ncbi:flagellar hook-length control protein FliK [Beggiatoa alba]|nr:flagellar hook-length control protein FliK [Beggiatoa alba]
MSETAISSQIVSEVSATSADASLSPAAHQTGLQSEASDFNKLLEKKLNPTSLDPVQMLLDEQGMIDLNSLFNLSTKTDPAINYLNASTEQPLRSVNGMNMSGNGLPSPLPANGLLANQAIAGNPALTATMPVEGQYKTTLSIFNPLSGQQSNSESLDGVLTSQLSTNFNEKNFPNLKQLDAQVFKQLINQGLTKQELNLQNNLITGVNPGLLMNQSLSLHSSEAVLPAISVSPDNPQWNAQVGDRINWMVNNQIQRADIRLDPPELGTLDVRLNIGKDNQASILFHVSNATAKEAIDSAIPRLREMFEQQGLNLVNVDVSQHQSSFAQSHENDTNTPLSELQTDEALNADESHNQHAVSMLSSRESSEHLLDLFA